MRDVYKAIRETEKAGMGRRELVQGEIKQIFENTYRKQRNENGVFYAICDAFTFGYSAGLKAGKAAKR